MNRELVESATHPEALDAIVAELGEEWQEHANRVQGGQLADGLTAANAIIRRNKSFFTDNHEVLFGSNEGAHPDPFGRRGRGGGIRDGSRKPLRRPTAH